MCLTKFLSSSRNLSFSSLSLVIHPISNLFDVFFSTPELGLEPLHLRAMTAMDHSLLLLVVPDLLLLSSKHQLIQPQT
jgi:hypothetical protein